MKGGVVKTVMARMEKTVVVTAKRRGMVAMVGWGGGGVVSGSSGSGWQFAVEWLIK